MVLAPLAFPSFFHLRAGVLDRDLVLQIQVGARGILLTESLEDRAERERLEVAAEGAAAGVVPECGHVARQGQEHILEHFLGIRLLEPPHPGKADHQGPITLAEFLPGQGILAVGESAEQADVGGDPVLHRGFRS